MGKNGCGKTTLLKAIDGLVPSTGKVWLNDTDILSLSVKERAKTEAYLPQTRPLAQIHGRLLIEHGRFPHLDFSKKLHGYDNKIVEQAIDATETRPLINKYTSEMSGGELQRIYIASALAQETPILLFDEPTTHLDLKSQNDILKIMQSLKDKEKTIITVLHDIVQAFSISDYMYIMDGGKIVDSGTPEALYDKAYIKEIFGYSLKREEDENALYKYKLVTSSSE